MGSELARVMLIFGVCLLERIGMFREVAGVMDTAEAATAKTGIGAAVCKSPITKSRTSASKAAEVEPPTAEPVEAATVEPTEPATVEPAEATSAKSPKSAAECRCAFDTDHETRGQSGTCQ